LADRRISERAASKRAIPDRPNILQHFAISAPRIPQAQIVGEEASRSTACEQLFHIHRHDLANGQGERPPPVRRITQSEARKCPKRDEQQPTKLPEAEDRENLAVSGTLARFRSRPANRADDKRTSSGLSDSGVKIRSLALLSLP
jgi:hypothetical protein